MNRAWFRPCGWIYRPVRWPGVMILALLLIYCGQLFIVVDRNSHSGSDTVYGILPYWIPAFLIYLWIAAKSGAK